MNEQMDKKGLSAESKMLVYVVAMTALYIVGLVYMAFNPSVAFGADIKSAEAEKRLRALYPNYSFKAVEPSPIAGVYTVIGDKNIIYFAPESGHLLVGDLWSPAGDNLTQALRERAANAKLAGLPLDKAVKIGSGKNIVIEVTDPDCPFCRRGSEFLSLRNDITRYIYFTPLPMHPKAESKINYILTAADPEIAYAEVMAGKYDSIPVPAVGDRSRLNEHKAIVASLGVKGTPAYWINGTFVSGADTARIQQLLQ